MRYVIIACLLCLLGCGTEVKPEPEAFVLDQDYTFTVKQKSRYELSMVEKGMYIELDDITGGQVMVELRSQNEGLLRPQRSIREYDVLSFKYKNTELYLQLVKMRNFLMGSDDNADFLLTQNKDNLKKKPTEKRKTQ